MISEGGTVQFFMISESPTDKNLTNTMLLLYIPHTVSAGSQNRCARTGKLDQVNP